MEDNGKSAKKKQQKTPNSSMKCLFIYVGCVGPSFMFFLCHNALVRIKIVISDVMPNIAFIVVADCSLFGIQKIKLEKYESENA